MASGKSPSGFQVSGLYFYGSGMRGGHVLVPGA
jgi:hypothetical protein